MKTTNPRTDGFTLVGYASSPLGLGEDLRAFAAMLEHLHMPFSVIDLPTESTGQVRSSWTMQCNDRFAVQIHFMSPMTCQQLMRLHPTLFDAAVLNIGYFLWELPDFPKRFLPALERMDQIWCPTHFVQDTFFKQVKKLVLCLPLPVLQAPGQGVNFRKQLGIAPEAFVSLYLFDVHSTLQRKNPQAAVQAFLRFARHQRKAHLVLKVNRLDPQDTQALHWIPRHPRIHVLAQALTPAQLTDLYQSADCYLSMHRSEGFGRTLVEAMQNGLELVCSDFSGPGDFLTADNAHLLGWSRLEVKAGDYPHTPGSWWADPSVEDAVRALRGAYQRRQHGPNRAGQNTALTFSPAHLAAKYFAVLKAIQTEAIRRLQGKSASVTVR
jgi:glycosyltransferase involved in cell wall biosynthesis